MDSTQLDPAAQPITTIPKMDSHSVQRDPPQPTTTTTSRKNSAQLAPVPQPIAIFHQFIAGQTEVLHILEKVFSLSGDSFDVKNADGQPVLKVKGQVLSSRKTITDTSDNHLFDLSKERFHLHTTYLAKSPDGTEFLKVRSELKLFGSKAIATFTSPTGTEHVLTMKGGPMDRKASIVDDATGAVVARINRKLFRPRGVFFGQQTYAVTVAPGVDKALITALCICFDEKNND